jgi:type IV secretion system protein VirB6/type IV secretion system protein TrbL
MIITKPRVVTCAAALAALSLLLIPEIASASDTGIMDSVMEKYQVAATSWGAKMVAFGSWLFWGLAIISMTWTYGMMLLRKADLGEFFGETIRFFGTLGFFWWVLLNGPAISKSIIDSMWDIGANVAGGADAFTPSGITDIGFNLLFRALDNSSSFSPIDSAVAIILSAAVLVILLLIAVNMLLLFVSSWFLMYGGAFLLGFGGSRWTSDIAITYYKTVLGLGVQIMSMILLIGIGKTFIDQAIQGMTDGMNLKELSVLTASVIVLLYLTNKIPPMLSGIVGGASTGGIGGFGAGAAIGAAAAAAGIAAGIASAGASLAAGGAANMAGAGSALKAAFQSAQENMGGGGGGSSESGGGSSGGGGGDTGSIGGSEGGGGGGGGGSDGGSSGGGSSGGGGGGGGGGSTFGEKMGTAGRFAADMAGSLASGAKAGLSAKASSMAQAASERIANTPGGKLAAEINGSAGQAREDQKTLEQASEIKQQQAIQEAREVIAEHTGSAQSSEPQFDGDSVGSGNDRNDEINEFVNGKA